MPALLEVRDLAVRYLGRDGSSVLAVDGASLDVEAGDLVGVLGESGCGKTTLLLAILGLLPRSARVERGSILFRGRDLRTLPERELRRLRGAEVSIVFQDAALALNPVRRVGPQIAEIFATHRRWPRRRCRDAATAMLAEVGFGDADTVYRAYPHELSGGQRQRVAIAQALCCGPALVLADEPTAALDSTSQAALRALLKRLQGQLGLALLLVTHDLTALAALARHVLVMYAGRLVETGTPETVFSDPLHPYTRGLLQAFPAGLAAVVPPGRRALVPIPGPPPDMAHPPVGCAFEPRCAERLPLCVERPPGEVSPAAERRVRCFTHGG